MVANIYPAFYNSGVGVSLMIKKILPIIVIATSMAACKNTSNSGSEFDYDAAYQEIETFFSSPNNDFIVKLNTAGSFASLMSFYSDDEKIIRSTYNNADLKEITTKDKSVLYGDGFKVYIEKDNSSLFNNKQINIKQYFKKSSFRSYSKTFEFTMNLKEASTKTGLLDSDALDELNNEFLIDLENVDFLVEFNSGRISNLSMMFDKYSEQLFGIPVQLRIVYSVTSYGDNLRKRTISLDDYLKVDQATYDIVEKDFAYKIEYGYGYGFSSNLSYSDYFINEVPENAVVAYLDAPTIEDDIEILYKDLVFDKGTGKYTYSFAGKSFTMDIKIIDGKIVERKEEIPFDKISVNEGDKVTHDLDNNRVLITATNKIQVFDVSTVEVIKEHDIEGQVNQILVHDDVYHVTTVTETPSSGYYNDYDNRGLIYVINKTSLEVIDTIHIDTAPDYTVVDKRGDIIVCPGRGQSCPIYIYHPATKTTEHLCNYDYYFYHGSYLEYDKEKDMIIVNNTCVSSGIDPEFFVYQNGQYVHDKDHKVICEKGPSYATVGLYYNGYFVSQSDYIVNVKNWFEPVCTKYIDEALSNSWTRVIAFPGNGNIYIIREDRNKNAFIVKVDTESGDISTYFTSEKAENFAFAFVKDNLAYLYNKTSKSLVIFDLN